MSEKNSSQIYVPIEEQYNLTANITGDDFDATHKYLEDCNAFKDGDGYILRF